MSHVSSHFEKRSSRVPVPVDIICYLTGSLCRLLSPPSTLTRFCEYSSRLRLSFFSWCLFRSRTPLPSFCTGTQLVRQSTSLRPWRSSIRFPLSVHVCEGEQMKQSWGKREGENQEEEDDGTEEREKERKEKEGETWLSSTFGEVNEEKSCYTERTACLSVLLAKSSLSLCVWWLLFPSSSLFSLQSPLLLLFLLHVSLFIQPLFLSLLLFPSIEQTFALSFCCCPLHSPPDHPLSIRLIHSPICWLLLLTTRWDASSPFSSSPSPPFSSIILVWDPRSFPDYSSDASFSLNPLFVWCLCEKILGPGSFDLPFYSGCHICSDLLAKSVASLFEGLLLFAPRKKAWLVKSRTPWLGFEELAGIWDPGDSSLCEVLTHQKGGDQDLKIAKLFLFFLLLASATTFLTT